LLQQFTPLGVMGISIILTAFNDNTAISYLSTLVPEWGPSFKYALFSGVVAGGGLTVIGNAPNPAGYAILRRHFNQEISPIKLFFSAALPTFILYVLYWATGPFF
jgi:Na+/H+ antiporter NhaD/arsenite permease-like protein